MKELIAGTFIIGISLQIICSAPISIKTEIDIKGLEFLQRFGYLIPPDPRSGKLLDEVTVSKSLEALQRMGGLNVTGILDQATKALMLSPRCGMPDIGPTDRARRKRRYKKYGLTWNKRLLTWKIANSNNDKLTDTQVKQTMMKAFSKWSQVAKIDFVEAKDNKPDIWVRFATKYHSDPFSFDGPGGTLAHAFYPDTDDLAGDVHFDDDETFSVGSPLGRDLLWVAVHELGHSIGLDHSSVKGAVMFAWYQATQGKDFDLSPDDVDGAKSLYGARQQNETAVATAKPSRPVCIRRFTAIYMTSVDKRTYVINGDKSYVMDPGMRLEKGPVETSKLFGGIKKVDAVFQRQWDKKTIVISGNKYYIFEGGKLVKGPGYTYYGFKGLPKNTQVDGAFVWPANNKLYIFSGRQYWRFEQQPKTSMYRMEYGYPRLIASAWKGVPDNIDSVFAWKNGKTYFFKDDKYYRVDDRHIKVGNDQLRVACKTLPIRIRESRIYKNMMGCSFILLLISFGAVWILAASINGKSITSFEKKKSPKTTSMTNRIASDDIPKKGERRFCATKDLEEPLSKQRVRKKRFVLRGVKWNKRIVTWRLTNYSPYLRAFHTLLLLKNAFNTWSRQTNLMFKRIDHGKADIMIQFGAESHLVSEYLYCSMQFDGRGGIIAHAFYPTSDYEFGGDIHFDASEIFSFDGKYGVNFAATALHEIGHSLGLMHSHTKQSVMNTEYILDVKGSTIPLQPDDIIAIRSLYGMPYLKQQISHRSSQIVKLSKQKTNPNVAHNSAHKPEKQLLTTAKTTAKIEQITTKATTIEKTTTSAPHTSNSIGNSARTKLTSSSKKLTSSTTQSTAIVSSNAIEPTTFTMPTRKAVLTTNNDVSKSKKAFCPTAFDAIFLSKNRKNTYVIQNGLVFSLGKNLQRTKARMSVFKRFSLKSIDAAYRRRKSKELVVFSGQKYATFRNKASLLTTGSIYDLGLPPYVKRLDAVVTFGIYRNTYLFAGKYYWRFNEKKQKVDVGYPKKISSIWKGLPNNVDSAITWRNRATYFFKGPYYYRIDPWTARVEPGYPKTINRIWTKC
eukprot:gene4808-5438_t